MCSSSPGARVVLQRPAQCEAPGPPRTVCSRHAHGGPDTDRRAASAATERCSRRRPQGSRPACSENPACSTVDERRLDATGAARGRGSANPRGAGTGQLLPCCTSISCNTGSSLIFPAQADPLSSASAGWREWVVRADRCTCSRSRASCTQRLSRQSAGHRAQASAACDTAAHVRLTGCCDGTSGHFRNPAGGCYEHL